MARAISFASNSLQTFDGSHGIITTTIQHAGKTAKRAQSYALSHANRSNIPFVDYPNKPVTITGTIVGTTIDDCDNQIDLFNSYLLTQGGNLDVNYNGSTRRFIATATNIDVDRPDELAYAHFTVTFTCTMAFGQDTSQTTAVNASGRTASGYTDNYSFLGTAPIQLPVITTTLSAVTGATNQFISVGNNNSGQAVTVTRTWTAGDVLVIDATSQTNPVMVNGIGVDFTGAIPTFKAGSAFGSSAIGYSDGFTTRTFNYNIVYTAMYV